MIGAQHYVDPINSKIILEINVSTHDLTVYSLRNIITFHNSFSLYLNLSSCHPTNPKIYFSILLKLGVKKGQIERVEEYRQKKMKGKSQEKIHFYPILFQHYSRGEREI